MVFGKNLPGKKSPRKISPRKISPRGKNLLACGKNLPKGRKKYPHGYVHAANAGKNILACGKNLPKGRKKSPHGYVHAALSDRAVPCVYALMECKTKDAYRELFAAIDSRCAELDCTPGPTTVVTDFEVAAMEGFRDVFGDGVETHGCFFHPTQATWRKLQDLGLAATYKEDGDFRLFCGMVDGLAFLPVDKVKDGMAYLRTVMPSAAAPLVEYFDTAYVSGSVGATQTGGVRRQLPKFPPATWNVFEATVNGGNRTNNYAEGWNNYLQHLVGHQHPSIWRLIEALQADNAEASTKMLRHAVGTLFPIRSDN